MKRYGKKILIVAIVFLSIDTFAQDIRPLDQALLNTLKIQNAKLLDANRTMEQHCGPATFSADWDGFPLIKCKYSLSVESKPFPRSHSSLAGGDRINVEAEVIMLNPEKDIVAKWVLASCMITHPSATTDEISTCFGNFVAFIQKDSEFQFPVAGIVLEDLRWYKKDYGLPSCKPSNPDCGDTADKGDGMPESYLFRDGVTVKLRGSKLNSNIQQIFDQIDIDYSLRPNVEVEKISSENQGPARIAHTIVSDYKSYFGSRAKDTTGINWLKIVRDLYQDAWKRAHNNSLPETVEKYRNDLLVAKNRQLN